MGSGRPATGQEAPSSLLLLVRSGTPRLLWSPAVNAGWARPGGGLCPRVHSALQPNSDIMSTKYTRITFQSKLILQVEYFPNIQLRRGGFSRDHLR